jgi:hypothetical protein
MHTPLSPKPQYKNFVRVAGHNQTHKTSLAMELRIYPNAAKQSIITTERMEIQRSRQALSVISKGLNSKPIKGAECLASIVTNQE